MEEDVKRNLETLGCKIEEDNDRVIVSCPIPIIKSGINYPMKWELENAQKRDENLVLRFKVKEEE